MTEKSKESTTDRELFATRLYDAPRDLVFQMWSDPDHIGRWWGPRGFTTTTESMDLRPGGVWKFVMHGPDGTDYPNKIVYTEVVRPERLVYRHSGDDGAEPMKFHVTVTFTEESDKTRLNMRLVFDTAEERDRVVKKVGAEVGLHETLDRLGEQLAKK